MTQSINMGTGVLCCVHKAGGTRPALSHTRFMMAMEGVKVAGCMAWIHRGSKVARLLKVVYTCVGWYLHMLLSLSFRESLSVILSTAKDLSSFSCHPERSEG